MREGRGGEDGGDTRGRRTRGTRAAKLGKGIFFFFFAYPSLWTDYATLV